MHSRFAIFTLVFAAAVAAPAAQAASRLINVSVRSGAGAGTETLIVGFTIAGSGAKQMLVRGVGPTLGAFNVAGAVADPELQLYDQAQARIAANDNWGGVSAVATTAVAVGAFALPAGSGDAALLEAFSPGPYSAHLVANSGNGIALVEAYDADPADSSARIANVSTRSLAGTGARVLTIGFVIAGDGPKTILIRAVGPSLAPLGVSGALANPQLRLFTSKGGEIGQNDNWPDGASWSAAFASVGAFPLPDRSIDAALLVHLAPGAYTAQASGANDTTGVALIEVYEAPNLPLLSFVLQPVDNETPPDFPSLPGSAGGTFPVTHQPVAPDLSV